MKVLEALRRVLRRPSDRPVNEVIAAARRASEAQARATTHNPDAPDADLRYLPAGPTGP